MYFELFLKGVHGFDDFTGRTLMLVARVNDIDADDCPLSSPNNGTGTVDLEFEWLDLHIVLTVRALSNLAIVRVFLCLCLLEVPFIFLSIGDPLSSANACLMQAAATKVLPRHVESPGRKSKFHTTLSGSERLRTMFRRYICCLAALDGRSVDEPLACLHQQ